MAISNVSSFTVCAYTECAVSYKVVYEKNVKNISKKSEKWSYWKKNEVGVIL